MKKYIAFATLIVALLLTGCGTKREYFNPGHEVQKLNFENKLPTSITKSTKYGVTLKNGQIITKDGKFIDIKIDDGFKFLNKSEDKIILSNKSGSIKVVNTTNELIFASDFPQMIVSASIQGSLLAAVSSSNHLYLIDLYEGQTLMEYKSSEIFAVDSRIAAPIFLESIIVYPALDGRIYVTNKNGQILKDMVISSEKFFNNVIFMDIYGDNMIAATSKKIIVINPKKTSYFDGEIKTLLRNGDNLFVFQKDGYIIKTDLRLNTLRKKYLKFAIFSDATSIQDNIYIIEKTGYLFKTDTDLERFETYKIGSAISSDSFIADDKFYYEDRYLKLQ